LIYYNCIFFFTYNEGHGVTKEYRASIYSYLLQYIRLSEEDIKKRFDFDGVEYKGYDKIDFSNRNIFVFQQFRLDSVNSVNIKKKSKYS
jgi:hypothetical protein